MFDGFTDFTPAQEKLFQQMLGDDYAFFLKIVSTSRHLNVETVNNIAQGRVWTGRKAKDLKLIDAVGDFSDAMDRAKKLAGMPTGVEAKIVELPEQPGLLERLLAGRVTGAQLGANPAQALAPMFRVLRSMMTGYNHFRAAYCPVIPVL
jgi:protease-4